MTDRKFEVEVYFDGPFVHGRWAITVIAHDPIDAVREAVLLIGLPKIGEIREVP